MANRRFSPPWMIEERNNACLNVRDNTGQWGFGHFNPCRK